MPLSKFKNSEAYSKYDTCDILEDFIIVIFSFNCSFLSDHLFINESIFLNFFSSKFKDIFSLSLFENHISKVLKSFCLIFVILTLSWQDYVLSQVSTRKKR